MKRRLVVGVNGEIAKKWTSTFYETYQRPVVVSAGIHYDGIRKEQIMDIVQITDEVLADFVKLYGEVVYSWI